MPLRTTVAHNHGLHPGHLGGGNDRNIFSREEFFEKAKYIEENPVRKGLVECAEDYLWSSAGSPALGRDPW